MHVAQNCMQQQPPPQQQQVPHCAVGPNPTGMPHAADGGMTAAQQYPNGYASAAAGPDASQAQQQQQQQQQQQNIPQGNPMPMGGAQYHSAQQQQQQQQPQQQLLPGNPGVHGQVSSPYGGNNGQYQPDSPMRSALGVQPIGNMNYQHSPITGNPTPPLTPAGSMTPYVSPNSNGKRGFNDIKPLRSKDQLITFPMRNCIIMAPFRLEHNLFVSNRSFQMPHDLHSVLKTRPEDEVELKCFHHDDNDRKTNWPSSIQISVNMTPLIIDRGDNNSSHKPLYLKNIFQAGHNTIQITVSACCCAYRFILQVVKRQTVQSVLQDVLKRQHLTMENGVWKTKQNFNETLPSNGIPKKKDVVNDQTLSKVTLKCPITFTRISLPARGERCLHIECFDLQSFLQRVSERGNWNCPVCNVSTSQFNLEVDHYMLGILNSTSWDMDEAMIDSSVFHNRREQAMVEAIKKDMTPGSMNMPTMNSRMDAHKAMSLHMPPDMNSNGIPVEKDVVEQTSIKVPLKYRISRLAEQTGLRSLPLSSCASKMIIMMMIVMMIIIMITAMAIYRRNKAV